MTQPLSSSNSPNPDDATYEANFEANVFSSIMSILREDEIQTSDEDIVEQFMANPVEFPSHFSDEESDAVSRSGSATPTKSKEHMTTAELERLVQLSELRMKKYLAFLKEKDDKLKGVVATGNRSGKLFVRVSPTPMEVDDEPEISACTSKGDKGKDFTEKAQKT